MQMVDGPLVKFCVEELQRIGFSVSLYQYKREARDVYTCYGGKFLLPFIKNNHPLIEDKSVRRIK